MSGSSSTTTQRPKPTLEECRVRLKEMKKKSQAKNAQETMVLKIDDADHKDNVINKLTGVVEFLEKQLVRHLDTIEEKDKTIEQLVNIKQFFANGIADLTRNVKALEKKCDTLIAENNDLIAENNDLETLSKLQQHELENLSKPTCDVNATHFPGYLCNDPSCNV
jgi:DNA repair exonuclease SbcCD ATPase subunit